MNDGDRFDIVVRQIVGKRLTWDQLTGKTGEQETCAGSREAEWHGLIVLRQNGSDATIASILAK